MSTLSVCVCTCGLWQLNICVKKEMRKNRKCICEWHDDDEEDES